MTLALATGWFPTGTSLAGAAEATRKLGLARIAFDLPGPVAAGSRDDLKPTGVTVAAVVQRAGRGASVEDAAAFATGLEAQLALTAHLKAGLAVCEGGGLGVRLDRDLARRDGALRLAPGGDEQEAVRASREPVRAAATERAARALHAAARAHLPVAVRNGRGAADLLHFEETEWLLDALPGLILAFDPARALRLQRLGLGPAPTAWAERFAARIGVVFLHGLGADLEGGSHPEDGAPDWAVLRDILPARADRVLDLAPALTPADVEDVVRYVRSDVI